MIVRAPGKVLLSGPYVVLDGVPATVLAVARYARANASFREVAKAAEVCRAYAGLPAPQIDLTELTDGQRKLGLGSSAAGLVAALAADDYEDGRELESPTYRRELFERAFAIHRVVQGGGSGFDVAAAVWGGFFRYELRGPGRGRASPLLWPAGLELHLFATQTSARTSECLARVGAFRRDCWGQAVPMFAALRQASLKASVAFAEGAVPAVIEAQNATREILAAIGHAAEVPIVLPPVERLGRLAAEEGATFFPAGAGGGDVCVRLGPSPPSRTFLDAVEAERLIPIELVPDALGVHAQATDLES